MGKGREGRGGKGNDGGNKKRENYDEGREMKLV